jgi:hypothetical protein
MPTSLFERRDLVDINFICCHELLPHGRRSVIFFLCHGFEIIREDSPHTAGRNKMLDYVNFFSKLKVSKSSVTLEPLFCTFDGIGGNRSSRKIL